MGGGSRAIAPSLKTFALSFFEEALAELQHERAWYAARSLSAETGFLREVDQAIRAITEHPERWPRRGRRARRYVFPTYPFSFIYIIEITTVFVVAL